MRRAPSPWPVLLALVVLGAAVATLGWLRMRIVQTETESIRETVERLGATGLLGRPEDASVDFRRVALLVGLSENDLIRRIHIVKRLADGREVTIHPFHADLSTPEWRRERSWRVEPIGDPIAGEVYLAIDTGPRRLVDAVIGLLGLLIAGGLGILLVRQRGKERQVSRLQEELEQRRQQIIELERLALAGQLSANIFHDIRKPVLNLKHELTDAIDEPNLRSGEWLRSLRDQTDLFFQMLRDLGVETFVNARDREPEFCDLYDLVERSLRLVRYEQGDVVVEVRKPNDALLVHAIGHRLVQVFSNLALNAFQVMEGKGRLLVSFSMRDEGFDVRFEDSGPGIPEEIRDEIFSPFFTTRSSSGGSGLGLYICRMIAEEAGGTISLGPRRELNGAVFVVSIPAARETSSQD